MAVRSWRIAQDVVLGVDQVAGLHRSLSRHIVIWQDLAVVASLDIAQLSRFRVGVEDVPSLATTEAASCEILRAADGRARPAEEMTVEGTLASSAAVFVTGGTCAALGAGLVQEIGKRPGVEDPGDEPLFGRDDDVRDPVEEDAQNLQSRPPASCRKVVRSCDRPDLLTAPPCEPMTDAKKRLRRSLRLGMDFLLSRVVNRDVPLG